MIYWIITGFIAPIPLFHLWLHALLPWWRKHPILFYACAVLVWAASFALFAMFDKSAGIFFISHQNAAFGGYFLIIIGFIAGLSSIAILGPKRFFVWAVLRPESVQRTRISKGPFHWFPHPAYLGYLLISIGNFLASGKFYSLLVAIFLFTLTPMVILLEEKELKRRIETQ